MKLNKSELAQLSRASDIIRNRGLTKLKLYDFGIYHQYEMAGKKIRQYLLDYTPEEITDDDYEMLLECLEFTARKGFTDKIGFPDEGQNRLILTDQGKLIYETFKI